MKKLLVVLITVSVPCAAAERAPSIARNLIERSVITLAGNERIVETAHFSPDGKKVLTVSGHIVKVWNAETGLLERELVGHTDSVSSAEFSPDGTKIVTASNDSTAKIWNAENGKRLQSLVGHTKNVNYAEFSPDGKYVVTASEDKTAKIWNGETGQEVRTLVSHTDTISSAKFSPDGTKVVTASFDKTAKVWDAESGALLKTLEGHRYAVNSAEFSHDGKYIVTAASDDTAKIWNTLTGALVKSLECGATVTSAHFSPDDTQVITVADSAQIWDVATGTVVHDVPSLRRRSIISAQFSPNGRHVVAGYFDGTAKIWDVTTGTLLHNLVGHTDRLNSAEFSPNGKKVVTAADDHTAKIWTPDARVVGDYLNKPRVRTNRKKETIIEPAPLADQALLVALDALAQHKNGAVITRADLVEEGLNPVYFFARIDPTVLNALKSVYDLSDDIFDKKTVSESSRSGIDQ